MKAKEAKIITHLARSSSFANRDLEKIIERIESAAKSGQYAIRVSFLRSEIKAALIQDGYAITEENKTGKRDLPQISISWK